MSAVTIAEKHLLLIANKIMIDYLLPVRPFDFLCCKGCGNYAGKEPICEYCGTEFQINKNQTVRWRRYRG